MLNDTFSPEMDNQYLKQYRVAADRAAFLEALSANVPGGYHRCGTGEGFPLEFVSDSFLETVGWTREAIIEQLDNKFINIVAPEDRELFLGQEAALVQNGRVNLAYRIRCQDGSRRWVQDSTLRVERDGQSYYQCVLVDITDFVREQEAMAKRNLELAQTKNLLETMEENMPSGYHRCRADAGCTFLYIGKHFTDIVGFTKEEIERDFNNQYRNLMWEDDEAAMQTYDRMRNRQGKGNSYDTSVYRLKHKDGGYRWVTDSTMFVDRGEDSFFQATVADITEHIEKLEEAKKKAEESNLAKSTFLFNASHDIRTPMNAIQGFAHMIEQNAEDPEIVLGAVRKLRRAGDILLTLLNDVLELSRIERGKEIINKRPMNMLEHVDKLMEMMKPEMEEMGIHFSVENAIKHPMIVADDLKMTRIAMNLLSNAKKFTPSGGSVRFGVQETEYDGKQAIYTLIVQDTGIGMSEEFQVRAFEQFERERSSTVSGVSGSGLGLAIIKSFADLMGGSYSIRSKLGEGTRITCSIPCEVVQERDLRPEIKPSAVDFSGMRLLLVEDNDFNREIAHYVFESVGFSVEEAVHGVDCLEKLNAATDGYYDFVLMDIQMPVMDGYVATREIRMHSNPAIAKIPVIAMTANAFDEDRRRCMEVGMDGHISKPLEAQAVLQELLRVIGQK